MISPDEAITRAMGIRGSHAKRLLGVKLQEDGRTYLVQYGTSQGVLHVDIYVDSSSGEVIRRHFHDISVFTYEDAVLERLQKNTKAEENVKELLRDGRRVEALKLWRKTFKRSLQEAKAAIDELSKQL